MKNNYSQYFNMYINLLLVKLESIMYVIIIKEVPIRRVMTCSDIIVFVITQFIFIVRIWYSRICISAITIVLMLYVMYVCISLLQISMHVFLTRANMVAGVQTLHTPSNANAKEIMKEARALVGFMQFQ